MREEASPASASPSSGRPGVGDVGIWALTSPIDDVLGSDEAAAEAVRRGSPRLGFPRDWPAAFRQSAALRALISRLKGKHCRAISAPAPSVGEVIARTAPALHPLHAPLNAQRLAAALPGWSAVAGWIVFELLDREVGGAFVALRHAWSEAPGGAWVDATPRLVAFGDGADERLLLVEGAGAAKHAAPLTRAGVEFIEGLARRLGRDREAGMPQKAVAPTDGACAALGGLHVSGAPGSPRKAAGSDGCLADGVALFKRGHVAAARRAYDAAIGARIRLAEAGRGEADGARRAGDAARALVAYEGALRSLGTGPKPGHVGRVPAAELVPYAYGYEVGAADALGEPATAEFARLLRLRTAGPLLAALHAGAAAALIELGAPAAARAAASAALKVDPPHVHARCTRAAACRQLGALAAACDDLASALNVSLGISGGGAPPPARSHARAISRDLVACWILRAPELAPYIAEAAAEAERAACDACGDAGAAAVEGALCCALHAIGDAGRWARGSPAAGAPAGVDGPRALALPSAASLVIAAHELAASGDATGARCLTRAGAWLLGVRGADGAESALLAALHEEAGGSAQLKSTRFAGLMSSAPSSSVGGLQLLEALARRRVSNCPRLFVDYLSNCWSFRDDARVRRQAASTIAWVMRCPTCRGRFDFHRAEDIKPITERARRYRELCAVREAWEIGHTDAVAYTRETGISIGDGATEES